MEILKSFGQYINENLGGSVKNFKDLKKGDTFYAIRSSQGSQVSNIKICFVLDHFEENSYNGINYLILVTYSGENWIVPSAYKNSSEAVFNDFTGTSVLLSTDVDNLCSSLKTVLKVDDSEIEELKEYNSSDIKYAYTAVPHFGSGGSTSIHAKTFAELKEGDKIYLGKIWNNKINSATIESFIKYREKKDAEKDQVYFNYCYDYKQNGSSLSYGYHSIYKHDLNKTVSVFVYGKEDNNYGILSTNEKDFLSKIYEITKDNNIKIVDKSVQKSQIDSNYLDNQPEFN